MASIQINHTNQYGPYNTWPQQQWPHGYMHDYMNHMDSIAKIQGGSTPESQLDRRFSWRIHLETGLPVETAEFLLYPDT